MDIISFDQFSPLAIDCQNRAEGKTVDLNNPVYEDWRMARHLLGRLSETAQIAISGWAPRRGPDGTLTSLSIDVVNCADSPFAHTAEEMAKLVCDRLELTPYFDTTNKTWAARYNEIEFRFHA